MLITAGALAYVLGVHFDTASTRIAAIGDVFAGGIFLFALLAGVVAVLAYADSSRRPRLSIEWLFEFLDGRIIVGDELVASPSGTRALLGSPPPGLHGDDPVPLEPVKLRLKVRNIGDVVARNVAIGVLLEGIFFDPPPTADPESRWSFRHSNREGWWQVQFEGGTDWAVYPGPVPRELVVDLTGMWAATSMPNTGWGAVIVAADGLNQPVDTPLCLTICPPTEG